MVKCKICKNYCKTTEIFCSNCGSRIVSTEFNVKKLKAVTKALCASIDQLRKLYGDPVRPKQSYFMTESHRLAIQKGIKRSWNRRKGRYQRK